MIKKIIGVLLTIVALFLGYVGFQSSEYTTSREVLMNAPPEKIFPYINDSKKMNSWNPWMELDPKVKISFSGPEAGVGAKTLWEGGDKLGTGSATVIESIPNILVKTKLEYTEPYAMTQTAEIAFKANGSQTLVRWSVSGQNTFFARIMCFFMNMDKMIGGTFERGLNKLKKIVEA